MRDPRQLLRDYYAILTDLRDLDYQGAVKVATQELGPLWAEAYRASSPYETSLQLVDQYASVYAYDDAGAVAADMPARVVGAWTISSRDSLVELLTEDAARGAPLDRATRDRAFHAWAMLSEGISRSRLLSIRNVVGRMLGHDSLAAASLVARIETERHRTRWKYSGPVVRRLAEALEPPATAPSPLREQMRADEDGFPSTATWSLLAEAARLFDADARPDRSAVTQRLAAELANGFLELLEQLCSGAEGSRARWARVAAELIPALEQLPPRPRNTVAARQHRGHPDRDVGHFIAHGIGGPPDINFFSQDRRLNRGWSEQGKEYRRIEAYAANHPGRLFFSRPVYADLSDIPAFLQLGVLLPNEHALRIQPTEPHSLVMLDEGRDDGFAWWLGWFDNRHHPG